MLELKDSVLFSKMTFEILQVVKQEFYKTRFNDKYLK